LALAKSGATNSVSSPFFQGAGVINADRSTDLAAGIYGVYATPDEWQVGDWNGVEYLNFAKVAKAGSTYTKTYEVTNPSSYNINVGLTDGYMQLISKTQMTFTTQDESKESGFNFHSPDYLMKLDPALIPNDAEVMIVRYIQPYSSYDPNYDYSVADSSWRYMLYNWTDINKDGRLWVDKNNNSVVNHSDSPVIDNDGFYKVDYANSDIQQGEYVRVDYEFGGIGIPVIVHSPKQRMGDAYYFGFQHRANNHTVKTTTFQIGVEFYKRADLPWLALSTASLAVPANSTVTFDAVANIPANTSGGIYEGVIFMNDPGDANHAAHETALPVVANIITELPDNGSFTLGGANSLADTMYQNSYTHGYFNWYGGGWTGAGDWRHYFFNIDSADLANKNLLINTTWVYTPTDFNTWVLGPTEDCASNGVEPCARFGLDAYLTTPPPANVPGQPDPSIFGPYTLQPIGSSDPFMSGAAYPFHTSTGGPSDWLKVPLERTGLHEIALHNVVYAGKSLSEKFTVNVGTLKVEPSVEAGMGTADPDTFVADVYADSGVLDLNFTPTIGIPDLNASLSGGLATSHFNQPAVLVLPNGANFSAWDPDNTVVPFTVNQAGATQLKVHLIMPPSQDIDFFLVRDVNNNGLAEQGIDQQVGSSGNGAGEDEEITVANPVLGQYLAVMAGYSVSPSTGVNASWWYEVTAPGDLPTDPVDVFSNTIAISQTPFVTSTSTYTYVVTADDRAGVLHVSLGGFTSTANLDLYVTNSSGQIVASSTTTNTTSEVVTVKPASGQYRFATGAKYTIWVHGKTVPVSPTSANLHIWWDHLNVWLTAADPDVHVNAIGAGETVSISLHFDKPGWGVGDPSLSARLTAGMSVLPNAFDSLITLNRTDVPTPAFDVKTHMVGETSRGPSPLIFADSFGYGLGSAALTAAGEPITYTVMVTNTGDASGTALLESYWGNTRQSFQQFVITPTNFAAFTVGSTSGFDVTRTLAPGEVWTVSFVNQWLGAAGSSYAIFADLYDDATASYFGEAKSAWFIGNYRTFSTSSTNGFPAYTYKMSSAPAVLPGETFTYTISMLNPSSVAQAIKVTDTLPVSVTFVSATNGAVYSAGANAVIWSGSVPGTSLTPTTFEIVVTMSPSAVTGSTVVNTASFYNGVSNALITTKSASTDVMPSARLNLKKAVDKLIVTKKDTVKYTLVFSNLGPQAANPTTLVDMVPAEIDVVGATITSTKASTVPFWNAVNRTINWQGNLAAGEVVTVTYNAKPNTGASVWLALINLAHVNAPNAENIVYSGAVSEVIFTYTVFMPLIRK
jgi:uncharacterized repeat protein (TIGR01451 family)